MRIKIVVTILCLTAISVLASMYLGNDGAPPGFPEELIVNVDEGSVRVTSADGSRSELITAGDQASVNESNIAMKTAKQTQSNAPEADNTPVPAQPTTAPIAMANQESYSCAFSIVDALGDPISEGKPYDWREKY